MQDKDFYDDELDDNDALRKIMRTEEAYVISKIKQNYNIDVECLYWAVGEECSAMVRFATKEDMNLFKLVCDWADDIDYLVVGEPGVELKMPV